MKRKRTPLDELLLTAASAAHNHGQSGFRAMAAREADRLYYPKTEDHGEGKVIAANALRSLMRCLERFGDPGARALLAQGMRNIVGAIRAEPDRPKPTAEPNRFWIEGDAA